MTRLCVGITALRTVNPAQLGSVAITDNQSWVFSRHCTGGKLSLRMANKLTDGGNGSVDKYGPTDNSSNTIYRINWNTPPGVIIRGAHKW
jgi:hypothetical protein